MGNQLSKTKCVSHLLGGRPARRGLPHTVPLSLLSIRSLALSTLGPDAAAITVGDGSLCG